MNTKIALSDKELELVCNTGWILTKHAIVQKVYALLGDTLPVMESFLKSRSGFLPEEILRGNAKISKGENYQLLPYVMLDYPRCFGKDDTFAVRTFFWWGNFFSVSLQLAGSYKTAYSQCLKNNYTSLAQQGYFICIASDPWQHHFEKNNYRLIKELDENEFGKMMQKKGFIKIAKPLSVQQWNDAPEFIVDTFRELTAMLE